MSTLALFLVLGALLVLQAWRWKRRMARMAKAQSDVLVKIQDAVAQRSRRNPPCDHEFPEDSTASTAGPVRTCRKCGCIVFEPGAAA